jgi:hypothetical protein
VQKALYIVPVLRWILIRNSQNPSDRVKLTATPVCRRLCRIDHPRRITEDRRPLWCLHLHRRSTGACRRRRPKPTEPPRCHQPPPLSAAIPRWVNRVPTSPWCRRWKPFRVWWTGAPVTAYSSKPPPRARRAAVIAPPLPAESSWAVHPDVNDHD